MVYVIQVKDVIRMGQCYSNLLENIFWKVSQSKSQFQPSYYISILMLSIFIGCIIQFAVQTNKKKKSYTEFMRCE